MRRFCGGFSFDLLFVILSLYTTLSYIKTNEKKQQKIQKMYQKFSAGFPLGVY